MVFFEYKLSQFFRRDVAKIFSILSYAASYCL